VPWSSETYLPLGVRAVRHTSLNAKRFVSPYEASFEIGKQ
jgi:hypothetical protein